MAMQSVRFQMNSDDWKDVLKVLCWSAASSLVASVLAVLALPSIPSGRALVLAVALPVVNGVLVALKNWMQPFTKSKT